MNSSVPSPTHWKELVEPAARRPVIHAGRHGPSEAARRLTLNLTALGKSRALWNDTLFLGAVAALSVTLKVAALGLSGHDWTLLKDLGDAPQRSLPGLVEAIQGPQRQLQPVQLWYVGSLYRLFGPQPVGYHLMNGAVLLASVLLGHLLLRELDRPRVLCVAAPAGFALLSTAADGFSAFGYALAVALCLLSLYADLRALRQGPGRFWVLKPVALLALLAAGLASTATIPLLILAQLVTWHQVQRMTGANITPTVGRAGPATVRAGAAVGFLALGGLCSWIATGVAFGHTREMHPFDLAPFVGSVLGDQVLTLPTQVAETLSHSMDFVPVVGAATIVGVLTGSYLWHISSPSRSTMPSLRSWLTLTLVGLLVFCAGNAVSFTTMGAGRGAGIESGAGGTLAVLGFIGLVSTIVPSDLLRREVFSLLVTLVCMSAFLVSGAMITVREATFARQHVVGQHLAERLPNPPPHSTILIEQACPGAAFESSQELAGVLATTYRDPSLNGALLTSDVTVGQDGLTVSDPGGAPKFHAYGEPLFVYNEAERDVYRLRDADHAQRYFITYAARIRGCRSPIHG